MANLAVSASRIVAYIDQRLDGLLGCLDEDDTPPTREARAACLNILKKVEATWNGNGLMPLPTVTSAGEGDIFCQWVKEDKIAFIDVEATGATRLFCTALTETGSPVERTIIAPSVIEVRDALRGLAA